MVHSHGCKTVLTGEGSDELTAGYLYFHDAPSAEALFGELRRIFWHLHNVNCQRSDRMSMAHAVEARVPFLCPDMIQATMSMDAELKQITADRPEKAMLRELFRDEVPAEVLWRTKAMQCEGVGKTWVKQLQQMCEDAVSDEEWAKAAETFPHNTPHSKEEYLYRKIFEKHFPGLDASVQVWEGGCRAGGAPWRSAKYTRAGLADTSQLMSDDGEFRAPPPAGTATAEEEEPAAAEEPVAA
uniref:Asparagine synthetase domain-containing protein n=1 Tax=Alexandrium andersonii TaxID=327968 RepID=A0A7S2H411_9DINO